MSEILNQYQVKFYNRLGIGKTLTTKNEGMSVYIFDHYNLLDANQLLTDIKSVLDGNYPLVRWELSTWWR